MSDTARRDTAGVADDIVWALGRGPCLCVRNGVVGLGMPSEPNDGIVGKDDIEATLAFVMRSGVRGRGIDGGPKKVGECGILDERREDASDFD